MKRERDFPRKRFYLKFDGLNDLARFAKSESKFVEMNYQSSRRHEPSTRWDLNTDFNETIQLAETGWKDGAHAVKVLMKRYLDRLKATKQTPATYHDVTGCNVDIGAYTQGIPECMLNYEEDHRPAIRYVKIVIGIGAIAEFNATTLRNRGTAILALAEAMEQKNIATEIIAESTSIEEGYTIAAELPVKTPGRVLNLDRLAFVLTHPACFRRLIFAARERTDKFYSKKFCVQGGYGNTTQHPIYGPQSYQEKNMVYYPGLGRNASATDWTEDNATDTALYYIPEELKREILTN